MTTAPELPHDDSPRGPAATDPDENIRQVAALLAAYHRLTQTELGERIGITDKSSMSLRMQGKRPFKTSEVARMAEVFGVSVEVFFNGPDALFRHPWPRVAGRRPASPGGGSTLKYTSDPSLMLVAA